MPVCQHLFLSSGVTSDNVEGLWPFSYLILFLLGKKFGIMSEVIQKLK